MTNWEDARKAYDTAQNAEGSAARENEVFLSSIAGRKKQLSAAFETLSGNLVGSDMMKVGIQAGTGILQGLNAVTTHTGGWGSLAMFAIAGAGRGAFKRGVEALGKDATASFGKRFLAGMGNVVSETRSGLDFLGGIIKAHPVIAGLAAAGGAAMWAGNAIYNANYKNGARTQESITNTVTAYQSALGQLEDLTKQREELEALLSDTERSDVSITGQAQAESYRRQIASLDNQIAYQQNLADTNQQKAAAETARAMTMGSYYDRNFKLADGWDDFFNTMLGRFVGGQKVFVDTSKETAESKGWVWDEDEQKAIADRADTVGYEGNISEIPDQVVDTTPFTQSIAEAFAQAKDAYGEAQQAFSDYLNGVSEQDEETISDNLSKAATNFNTVLGDISTNLEAVTDPKTGEALKGYEDVYTQLRNMMNQAQVFNTSEEEFLNSLITRSQYKQARTALTNLAQDGADANTIVSRLSQYPDLVEIIQGAGIENGLELLAQMFVNAANGTGDALSLVEDNVAEVSALVSDAQSQRASLSSAVTEAYGVSGLSLEGYNSIGAYRDAMNMTSAGISLDYRKFQELRERNYNQEKYNLQKEIDDNLKEIRRLQAQKSQLKDGEEEQAQRIDDAIAVAKQNVKQAQAGRAILSGQYSDVTQFVDSLASGYSISGTTDTLAQGIASVQALIEEGKVSEAAVREFAELFTGQDLSDRKNYEIAEFTEQAMANAQKFFNFNDEGQVESFSADKTLATLAEFGEVMGAGFIDGDTIRMNSSDLMNFAQWAGISKEGVISLLDALEAYGKEVEIDDTTKQLSDYIEEAGNSLDSYNKKRRQGSEGLKDASELEADTIEKEISAVEELRREAGNAGDSGATEQLNSVLASYYQRREELERSSGASTILGMEPSKVKEGAGEIVQAMQGVLQAQENYDVGHALELQGVDIDIDALSGGVTSAYEQLGSALLDNEPVATALKEKLGDEFANMSTEDLVSQLPTISTDRLVSALLGSVSEKPMSIGDLKMQEYGTTDTSASEVTEESQTAAGIEAANGTLNNIDAGVAAIASAVTGEEKTPDTRTQREEQEAIERDKQRQLDAHRTESALRSPEGVRLQQELSDAMSLLYGGQEGGQQFALDAIRRYGTGYTADQILAMEGIDQQVEEARRTQAEQRNWRNAESAYRNQEAIRAQQEERTQREQAFSREEARFEQDRDTVHKQQSFDYYRNLGKQEYGTPIEGVSPESQKIFEGISQSSEMTMSTEAMRDGISAFRELGNSAEDAGDHVEDLTDSTDSYGETSYKAAEAAQEARYQEGVVTPHITSGAGIDQISTGDEVPTVDGAVTKEVVFEPNTSELEVAEAEAETPVEQPVEQTVTQRVQQVMDSGTLDTSVTEITEMNRELAVQIVATVTGTEDLEELRSATDGLEENTVNAVANAIGQGDVEALKTAIDALSGKTVYATAVASGGDSVCGIVDAINSLHDTEVTATVNLVTNHITNGSPELGGTHDMFGTANFRGSAYARGSWGTHTTQHNVLVGK